MKIIYIAHPISGFIEDNLEKVRQIARQLNLQHQNIVPFAPYWLDCHVLDNRDPKERKRGIKNDKAFFGKGVIDEVWLYGDTISRGMKAEIDLANKLNIPVKAMSEKTKTELSILNSNVEYEEVKPTEQ
jgi:hypothetical protein